MNDEQLIRLLSVEQEIWERAVAGEKLAGNVVKEALYQGTATGLKIAIQIVQENPRIKDIMGTNDLRTD